MRNRREFLKDAGRTALGVGVGALAVGAFGSGISACSKASEGDASEADQAGEGGEAPPAFEISLAQWSLHRRLFKRKGEPLDALDFAAAARGFGIGAIEYVNAFFFDKAEDMTYLGELKKRASDEGVRSLLIMVDREGALGDADGAARTKAVDNHRKWIDAARFLGCHSIRVNAQSSGTYEEQLDRAADGLGRVVEIGDDAGINVIVENHGGLSSNGSWLSSLIEKVGHERCGTLPDFGNFRIEGEEWYDRYQGVTELMPYARAVSAKSYDFDEAGNETTIDFERMMKIVTAAGYDGHVGIEYEGSRLSEDDGIIATRRLLERIRDSM